MSKYLDLKRSRKYKLREIVNGIFHFVKSGCQWRLLPSDFPKWQTVYYYFSTWKKNPGNSWKKRGADGRDY